MTLKRLVLIVLTALCLLCITCKSAPKKTGQDETEGTGLSKTEEEGEAGIIDDGTGREGAEDMDSQKKDETSLKEGEGEEGEGTEKEEDGSQKSGEEGLDKEEGQEEEGQKKAGDESDAAKAAEEEAARRAAENKKAIDALLKEIENSRRDAIAAGAADEFPALFGAADESLKHLRERAASGESSDELKQALENLNAVYGGMGAYIEAKEKKKRIDRNGYAFHDQTDYGDGAFMLADLEDIMRNPASFMKKLESGTSNVGKEFLRKANEANIDFSNVIKVAAMNERTAAFNAKKQADSVKASVSRKNDYDSALRFFRNGDSKYTNDNIEESIEDYIRAKEIFSKLYLEVGSSSHR